MSLLANIIVTLDEQLAGKYAAEVAKKVMKVKGCSLKFNTVAKTLTGTVSPGQSARVISEISAIEDVKDVQIYNPMRGRRR